MTPQLCRQPLTGEHGPPSMGQMVHHRALNLGNPRLFSLRNTKADGPNMENGGTGLLKGEFGKASEHVLPPLFGASLLGKHGFQNLLCAHWRLEPDFSGFLKRSMLFGLIGLETAKKTRCVGLR